MQAFLNCRRLRNPERFEPWLAGIGLNISRQWLGAWPSEVWSWEAVSSGRPAMILTEAHADPQTLAAGADLAARVRAPVADLPPGQRSAVLLFYLAGLTCAEVAAQLGIEVSAVKTRLYKARATLRRRLWTVWKEAAMTADTTSRLVEMRVVDVRRRAPEAGRPRHHVVILEEVDGSPSAHLDRAGRRRSSRALPRGN